jgi:hypothetical protein
MRVLLRVCLLGLIVLAPLGCRKQPVPSDGSAAEVKRLTAPPPPGLPSAMTRLPTR